MTAEPRPPPTRRSRLPSTATSTDAAAAYRRLRAEGPVVPMPGLEGALAAVSFEAVARGTGHRRRLRRERRSGRRPRGRQEHRRHGRAAARQGAPHHELGGRVPQEPADRAVPPRARGASPRRDDGGRPRTTATTGSTSSGTWPTPIPPAAMSRLFGFPESDAKEYGRWARLGRAVRGGAGQGREHQDGRPEPGAARLRRRQDPGAARAAPRRVARGRHHPVPQRRGRRRDARAARTSVRRSCS